MDLTAISAAATVAIAGTVIFVFIARSWQTLARVFGAHPSFPDSIMREAAQRLRDELDRLSRTQATYLCAGLIFVLLFVIAHTFDAGSLFAGYPEWQLRLLLGFLVFAALLAAWRLVRTILAWRTLRFMRDASIAVGHQLNRLDSQHGRVYHDVETSTGIVDHVLVGQGGIYAVNVVARRNRRAGSVRLDANELVFADSDDTVSIVDIASRTSRLERELRPFAGAKLRVRSVIAVPGWDIDAQHDDRHLIVNERTLPMLTGWKDQDDYLMNEDVESVQAQLTERCTRG